MRQYDPDRFFLALLCSEKVREDIFALFAFNHEIAKTREVVTETAMGHMRLQWWRDAIQKIYAGEVLQHEVIKPLASAIERHGLERDLFYSLIYAREFDLEDIAPASIEGVMNYADFTTTPLMKLCLQVLGQSEDEDIIRKVSVAYAGIGILRAVPYHRLQRRCYLPQDIMARYELSSAKLFDWKAPNGLIEVVREVMKEIPLETMPKSRFLKSVRKMAQIHARQIENLGCDVMNQRMAVPPPLKELRIFIAQYL